MDVDAAVHEARAPSCLHCTPSPLRLSRPLSSHPRDLLLRLCAPSLPQPRRRLPSRALPWSMVRRRRSCWGQAWPTTVARKGSEMAWPAVRARPQHRGEPAIIHVSSSSTVAAPRHIAAVRLVCFGRFNNVSFVPAKQYCKKSFYSIPQVYY